MKLSKPVIIMAGEPASKAIAKLEETGAGVFVFDKKKYLGLIDERKLREGRLDAAKIKAGSIVIKTPTLSPDSGVQEICNAFFAGRFKTLPVFENGELRGAIGRWDILNMLEDEGHLKGKKVFQHMTSPIMTVNSSAPVSVANALMRDTNVRRLAVLENGHLVGLISVFDLLPTRTRHDVNLPKIKHSISRYEKFPVYSFMKKEVETIEPACSLGEAAKKMMDTGKAALIVVEGKRPVGIITAKDILEVMVSHGAKLPVFVSGLHGLDKQISQDVVEEGEALLEKLKKSIGAESLSIHVKNVGSQYSVSAYIKGKKMLRSSATDFVLMDALRWALDELKGQGMREKETQISKRKNGR